MLQQKSINGFCQQENLRGVFYIGIAAPFDADSDDDSRESTVYFYNCFKKSYIKTNVTYASKLKEKFPFEEAFYSSLKKVTSQITILN